MQGAIPIGGGGIIVNTSFHDKSNYSIFEIIAFKNVKNLINSHNSITFQSDGHKVYLVYEPRDYRAKYMEPYLREEQARIPLRWNELEIIELSNRDRILFSQEPYISFGAFTVTMPGAGNFVYYFFESDQLEQNIQRFMQKVLREDFSIQSRDMEEIMKCLRNNLDVFKSNTELSH